MVKKTVQKHLKKISDTFRKLKFKPNKAVIVVGVIAALLLLSTGVAAFTFREKITSTLLPKSALTLTLLQPSNTQGKIISSANLEISLNIQTGNVPLQEKETPLKVLTTVDGNTLYQSDIRLAENSELKHSFSLPIEGLSEGEHQVEVSLRDPKDESKIADHKNFSLVKDTVKPTVNELVSPKTNSAQVSLRPDAPPVSTKKTASSSATASASAEKKNVSIFDTKPSAVEFSLKFSEAGKLTIDTPEGAQLTWTQETTDQPSISIAANQKTFTAPYHFRDQAGLTVDGTVTYTYDNMPPQITLKSSTEMTNKWGSSYAVMFVANEPLTSSFVIFNGQQLSTHTTATNNFAATIKLNMGDNPFTITATDKHGNTGSKNFSVKLTQDPEPVYWAGNPKPFKRCSDEDFSYCREKSGGMEGWGDDCSKWDEYKACVKSRCDNTVAFNLCP